MTEPKPWLFKPGQSGNPRGRPKGSRHKLSENFLANLSEHFDAHGMAAIDRACLEDPAAYVRVVASLLPKQTEKIPNPLADLTDDELAQLDQWLDALRGSQEAGQDGTDEKGSGE